MRENGNPPAEQMGASLGNLIIKALEDERYDWRTVNGLSEQTGIAEAKVQEVLADLGQVIVRSSVPDDSGRALYTTRRHYRQTHGVGTRFLSALSGKVA
jgi:hypothetical protein